MKICSLTVAVVQQIARKGSKPCTITMHYPPVVADTISEAMDRFFRTNAPPRPGLSTTVSFTFKHEYIHETDQE